MKSKVTNVNFKKNDAEISSWYEVKLIKQDNSFDVPVVLFGTSSLSEAKRYAIAFLENNSLDKSYCLYMTQNLKYIINVINI